MRRRKGFGCFSRIIIVIIAMFVIAVYIESNNSRKKPTPTIRPSTTRQVTNRPTMSSTPKPTRYTPGIAGSNAYDITTGLKNMNHDPGTRQTTKENTYTWQFSWDENGIRHSVYIEANAAYEVISASFSVTSPKDTGLLYWASTMPYDAQDKTQTAELLNSKREKSVTIGDAKWTIYPNSNSLRLCVEDVDYESWVFGSASK